MRGLDLDRVSFPGEGVMGLNHDAIVGGNGKLTQAERWAQYVPGAYSGSSRESVC